jgi:hypothetical protein
MSVITGQEIIDIIEKFGELKWRRTGAIAITDPMTIQINKRDNYRTRPSFTAWRYMNPDPEVEQAIVEAVESFKGNVKWIITVKETGNRNWLIITKKASDYQKEGKGDKEWGLAENYIAEHEPEFGIAANQDVPALAKHIEEYVYNKLGRERFKNTTD